MSGGHDADVLVLGLGPAGAAAAAAAAKAGARVIAIDRKKVAGTPVQCAEFVPALIGQDAPGVAATRSQHISSMMTFVEGLEPEFTPDFRGVMISRADFDRMLVEQSEADGAACRFGVAAKTFAGDGTIILTDGTQLRARVVVGADGPHSLAGKAIGQSNRDCVETRQVTVPLLKPHEATDIFLSADIPGGYGWLFPKQDKANLGLGVAPRWKLRLRPLLQSLLAALAEKGRVGTEILATTGGAIPVGGMLDPVGHLRDTVVLLAGDAAGLTNPVTGAGISSAVSSGRMAGLAAAAIAGGKAAAADQYREDLEDTFGAALRRALRRRTALMQRFEHNNSPMVEDLRAGWIAFPEYWAA